MKTTKMLVTALAVTASTIALIPPASAQSAGIATADPSAAILGAKAISAGYQSIDTAYASYFTQIDSKSIELVNLRKVLDVNKDNKLTDDELNAAVKANNPVVKQLQAKQQEIQVLQEPVLLAQMYVIENVSLQYETALQAATTAKRVTMVLSPDVVVWSQGPVDITQDITNSLNTRIPTVAYQPAKTWRPTLQTTPQLHQQLQEALRAGAIRQAQAQAAQPVSGTKPAATPAVPASKKPQPDGR
jgi:Skp family chaperone for outer membrane proteins